MESENGCVKEILERILSSYGVRSRQAYSDITKIPLPTISNWVKRGKVPGDYIIQCAVDTGADVRWLSEGKELTNVSLSDKNDYPLKGAQLAEVMQNSGGKVILRRILDAYGFSLQKDLGDHLGIPSGTMSAWVRREHFPGDVVIVCALDTGASLYWLATGNGSMFEKQPAAHQDLPIGISKINKYSIQTGTLVEHGTWYCDASLIEPSISKPAFIEKGSECWYVDLEFQSAANGRWLIDIDGNTDVYDVARLPGNRLSVKNALSHFECSASDINCIGVVFRTLSKNN